MLERSSGIIRDYGYVARRRWRSIRVGMHMMTIDDAHERIARLIAVNTPFPGTPLARYAVSAWREFAPDRAAIRTLDAATRVNARIVSIFSRFDQYIPASSRLEGAMNIELPLVGHFRVLEDPLLLSEVARWAASPG